MSRYAAAAFLSAVALAMASPAIAEETEDWAAVARSDIEAAYETYRENHPGWDDSDNPGFRDQLETARRAGLARAERASRQADYVDALSAFSAVLSDGHAQVLPQAAEAPKDVVPMWPGFLAAWRGQQAIVHSALPESGWIDGSVLSSCDGEPFLSFAAKRIARMGGRPQEDGQWWLRIPSVFVASSAEVPTSRCTALLPDGRVVDSSLEWTRQPEDIGRRWRAAGAGEVLPIGLTEPARGIFWIALPTFDPDERARAAYDRLLAGLEADQDALAAARAPVIDLRGNDGGSSSWSREVAYRLWGKDAVEARLAAYLRGVEIRWRASPDNLAYLDELHRELADQPQVLEFIAPVRAGMREAIASGDTYWIEADADEAEKLSGGSAQSALRTPIYVIVPGRCASACLDALDLFTRFGNTTLIGAPSSADSTYLEVRTQSLPSGKGRMVIPLKVWHGRPRPSGFVYQPRIRVDDPEWSVPVFLREIEADLTRK